MELYLDEIPGRVKASLRNLLFEVVFPDRPYHILENHKTPPLILEAPLRDKNIWKRAKRYLGKTRGRLNHLKIPYQTNNPTSQVTKRWANDYKILKKKEQEAPSEPKKTYLLIKV